jgi:hypothetical protein
MNYLSVYEKLVIDIDIGLLSTFTGHLAQIFLDTNIVFVDNFLKSDFLTPVVCRDHFYCRCVCFKIRRVKICESHEIRVRNCRHFIYIWNNAFYDLCSIRDCVLNILSDETPYGCVTFRIDIFVLIYFLVLVDEANTNIRHRCCLQYQSLYDD